ncbi:MAG: TolC family protein [Myxococcota bacterium]|nr:TolC family protein [Myxococcota bacterium]
MTFVAISIAAASPSTANTIITIDEPTFLRRVAETPRSRALAERINAARSAVGAAGVLPNPTLSYEREAVPSLDAHDDFVRLGWTIDLAGRRGLASTAARAGADAERASVQHATIALQLDARIAYLDAIYAREHLARLDEARTTFATIVDSLRNRSAQGDASSYDFDRAALELELLDDERATARRELEIARLRLGAFVGEPAAAYDAVGTLTLPAKPVDAGVPQRADLDAARARERQAAGELAVARRAWVPRFEVVAGLLASTTGDTRGIGYVVGIGGDIPLFDAGGAQAAKSRGEVRRWRSEVTALAVEATAETVQATRELVLRIEQAEVYAAGPAKRALDLQKRAAVAYREGDRPILELLDVQRASRHATVHVLRLTYEARRAELLRARALGRTP